MAKKLKKETECILTLAATERIRDKYPNDPAYAAQCLEDMLENFSPNMLAEDIEAVRKIIEELRIKTDTDKTVTAGKNTEIVLRQEILDYYVPTPLVNAFLASGGIPKDSKITQIGVGFIDIADYSYLSKFLSSNENQALLNGLYSCFSEVLHRRGGYLNKIEGDAIMFQFGGLRSSSNACEDLKEEFNNIATQLFLTCIEMQRLCYKFNAADESILDYLQDPEEKENVRNAFGILQYMRTDAVLANIFNALYQIRIRIGANVGEVSIGNFGPPGCKHWDIIGNPVIEAKRMESTAPIGGLRISESFFRALEQIGIIDTYYEEFVAEARKRNGYFRDIKKEEVFQYGSVILKDKKNVSFKTYAVLVDPGLPETIVEQIILLLEKGEAGADKIVDLIKYYRGNKHVIDAIEDAFIDLKIRLRKDKMANYLLPEKYMQALYIMGGDKSRVEEYFEQKRRLFDVLKTLGNYQDKLKLSSRKEEAVAFKNYEQYMESNIHIIEDTYRRITNNATHNTYFFNVIFPLIFQNIKGSILEYQYTLQKRKNELEVEKTLAGEIGRLFDKSGDPDDAALADGGEAKIDEQEELENLEEVEEVESLDEGPDE